MTREYKTAMLVAYVIFTLFLWISVIALWKPAIVSIGYGYGAFILLTITWMVFWRRMFRRPAPVIDIAPPKTTQLPNNNPLVSAQV